MSALSRSSSSSSSSSHKTRSRRTSEDGRFVASSHRDESSSETDTASAKSVPLSSPRHSQAFVDVISAVSKHDTLSERDTSSMFTTDAEREAPSSSTSAAPSMREVKAEESRETDALTMTYPPPPIQSDAVSLHSVASTSSRKVRPESLLIQAPDGPLVLGVALVDFNHLVGPRIEFSEGAIFEDEEVTRILPFLALPDGAHLSVEDYSYFHVVNSPPKSTTIFGISCNRQIAASALLVKDQDVTRSTVQKAVVVLASKPVFGPIRDKLGVVTRALFEQRDFSEMDILRQFNSSLESSLRSQLTESGLYMGTSLRELVHTFRQRTLILLKALILQKRIMFFGHPVERLCTFQYSLISLIPGLLQNLDDCGSPPLASRVKTLQRPTSLRTSDRNSLLAYLGLPLDVFGKDSLFQPYLPLQQLDLIRATPGWLCGTTNSIVTQQKEIDLLINVETNSFEFRNPVVERVVALTAADRLWMDDIVRDVNDGWNENDPTRPIGMQFKGSDDYLRVKFEEYISAALASSRYADFLAKGETDGALISGADSNTVQDFNAAWLAEFKQSNAYEVWEGLTDPMLFDIVGPQHPCAQKPTAITDISLRLQEGIHDLKIDQQLTPAKEALSRGSANIMKAVGGVRERWQQQRFASSGSILPSLGRQESQVSDGFPPSAETPINATTGPSASTRISETATQAGATIGAWGSSVGAYLSQAANRVAAPTTQSTAVETTSVGPGGVAGSVGAFFSRSASSEKQTSPEAASPAAARSSLSSFFAARSPEADASPAPSSPSPVQAGPSAVGSFFSSRFASVTSPPASATESPAPASAIGSFFSQRFSTSSVTSPAANPSSSATDPTSGTPVDQSSNTRTSSFSSWTGRFSLGRRPSGSPTASINSPDQQSVSSPHVSIMSLPDAPTRPQSTSSNSAAALEVLIGKQSPATFEQKNSSSTGSQSTEGH